MVVSKNYIRKFYHLIDRASIRRIEPAILGFGSKVCSYRRQTVGDSAFRGGLAPIAHALASVATVLRQSLARKHFHRDLQTCETVDHALVPVVPEIGVFFVVGNQTESVAHLLFVEFAEGAGAVHAAVHFVGLGRAGRAAEMSDRASIARSNVFDLSFRDEPKSIGVEHVFDLILEEVAATELSQPDELAAWTVVANVLLNLDEFLVHE